MTPATIRQSIETIVARVGEPSRDAVLSLTARLSDDQIVTLAGRSDIATLCAVRHYVGAIRGGRRPTSPPGQRFFTRDIRRLHTRLDRGERIVTAWELSCGHVIPTLRRVLSTTRTQSMPCPRCGSGTRTPFERRRTEIAISSALDQVYGQPHAREHFERLVRSALLVVSLGPLDRRQSETRTELTGALGALGLLSLTDVREDTRSA